MGSRCPSRWANQSTLARAKISGLTYTSTKVRRLSDIERLNLKHPQVGRFYHLLFDAIVSGKQPASGREGFYFLENGEYKQLKAVEAIAKALYARGKIASPEVVPSTEADLGQDNQFYGYLLGLGTSCRAKGERSRQLGWNPTQTTEEFYASIQADVDYCLGLETQ